MITVRWRFLKVAGFDGVPPGAVIRLTARRIGYAQGNRVTAGLLGGIGASAVDEERARAEYYRRRSRRFRKLAEKTGFPEIRIQLITLALRYERMAAYLEQRSPLPTVLADPPRD
jgi:hypothetical protein